MFYNLLYSIEAITSFCLALYNSEEEWRFCNAEYVAKLFSWQAESPSNARFSDRQARQEHTDVRKNIVNFDENLRRS
jgi:hypothetical protein